MATSYAATLENAGNVSVSLGDLSGTRTGVTTLNETVLPVALIAVALVGAVILGGGRK